MLRLLNQLNYTPPNLKLYKKDSCEVTFDDYNQMYRLFIGGEDYMSCPEDCDEPAPCETDVCLSFMNFNESAGTVDLWMENTVDVAGYQVEVEGLTTKVRAQVVLDVVCALRLRSDLQDAVRVRDAARAV